MEPETAMGEETGSTDSSPSFTDLRKKRNSAPGWTISRDSPIPDLEDLNDEIGGLLG